MTQAFARSCKPLSLLLIAGALGLGCAHQSRPAPVLDPEFAAAASWKYDESNAAWIKIDDRTRAAARPEQFAALEKQLILLLRTAPSEDAKRQACRRLALIGGPNAIPALASAMTQPALVEDARCALQANPDPDAERVLLRALEETSGGARVGVINALGARRDPKAIRALGRELQSADPETALAAAHALGNIGTRPAMRRLAKAFPKGHLPLQSEILQALLVDAARLNDAGYERRAANIYEQLYATKQTPPAVRLAALDGLAAIEPERWLNDVLERAADPNPDIHAPAARTLAGMPWSVPVSQRAVEKLPTLAPPSRALVLLALGERGDPAARPAATAALNDEDQQVRFAAIAALANLGSAAEVQTLIEVAAEGPDDQRAAAAESLSRLRGDGIDATLASVAVDPKLTESEHCRAVEALAARGSVQQAGSIFSLAKTGNPAEQLVALKALGQLAPFVISETITNHDGTQQEIQVQTLLAILEVRLAAPTQEVADAADAAYVTVAQRKDDPEARDDAAVEAYGSADNEPTLIALLGLMGELGGDQALETVLEAQRSESPARAEAARAALNKWPTGDAIPALLENGKTAAEEKQRILALQAVIRLAGADSEHSAAFRVDALKQVFAAARRPEEKKAALAAAGGIPDAASLRFVADFIEDTEVSAEARAAAEKLIADPALDAPELKQSVQGQMQAAQKMTGNMPSH